MHRIGRVHHCSQILTDVGYRNFWASCDHPPLFLVGARHCSFEHMLRSKRCVAAIFPYHTRMYLVVGDKVQRCAVVQLLLPRQAPGSYRCNMILVVCPQYWLALLSEQHASSWLMWKTLIIRFAGGRVMTSPCAGSRTGFPFRLPQVASDLINLSCGR